jgi:gamma-glutamyltranspeptidase/glutathione hydrolase
MSLAVRIRRVSVPVLLASMLCLTACQQAAVREPQAPPAWTAGVAAANPYAVEAGLEILHQGGSAVDAAVAVQAMLGLVEPQSSGLGGGAFLMYYEAATGRTTAFDGRESAPAGAKPDMFLKADGQPMNHGDGVVTGRSTGVPGAIAMLGLAHDRFGKRPWEDLFGPAIRAADQGFIVPPRLGRAANGAWAASNTPDARALFTRADGKRIQAGESFSNPAYAVTLRALAAGGPRTLLRPPFSTQIIERTHAEPLPGTLVQADFDAYQPQAREPLCGPFRMYVVCVPPPPSSGVALLQVLALLDHTDIAGRGPSDPQAWFLFAEASRLMYADRNQYVGDPAFVDVPVAGLLDPAYVAQRAAMIGKTAGPAPQAGLPPGFERGRDSTREPGGTSHFVVIDAAGNVVSMTTTVESVFGSGRVVGGFFINNQLTDFSFAPVEGGKPVANAVAGGKRPRSSMSPVIVLDHEGRLVAALGSPGGSAILAYNAKTLVGLLAWNLPMQQAIDLPNLIAAGDSYLGETDLFRPELIRGLAARRAQIKTWRGEGSGIQGFVVRDGRALDGAADPRRDGEWRTVGQPMPTHYLRDAVPDAWIPDHEKKGD